MIIMLPSIFKVRDYMRSLPILQLAWLFAFLMLHACSIFEHVKIVTVEGTTDTRTYRYIQQISNKIEIIGAHRYPTMHEHINSTTYIDIELSLSRYGKLLSSRILTPGNNPKLNEQLLEIINYSAPYPPLPDELDLDKLIIQKRWYFSPAR